MNYQSKNLLKLNNNAERLKEKNLKLFKGYLIS